MSLTQSIINDSYQYGFHEPENYSFKSKKGLSKKIVEDISRYKNEPKWMLDYRLASYEHFKQRPMPTWGADLSNIDFDDIFYYIKPTDKKAPTWDELPPEIKRTYDRIGVPEAEKKMLIGGVSAQYESEVVYKSIEKSLTKQGVIFLDMDSGLAEYPDIVKKYFGTVIPKTDNKFAFIGLAGIKDYEEFWNALEKISEVKGVVRDISGFKALIEKKLAPIDFTWFDTGSIDKYIETNKNFSGGEKKFDFSKK